MARKKSAGSIIVLQDSIGIEQASSIKKQFADSIKKNKTTFVKYTFDKMNGCDQTKNSAA